MWTHQEQRAFSSQRMGNEGGDGQRRSIDSDTTIWREPPAAAVERPGSRSSKVSAQAWMMQQGPPDKNARISHANGALLGDTISSQSRRSSLPEVDMLRNQDKGSNTPRRVGGRPPAFYIPPPGYGNDAAPLRPPVDPTAAYGGQGSWHQLNDGAMAWLPDVGSNLNPPTKWIEENILPALSHSDWTVPQAKQVLSSWATLATLLAGTQATLLSYFRQYDNGTFAVVGLACAGLCLEVYGALLASITIVSSISLQGPETGVKTTECHRAIPNGLHKEMANLFDQSRRRDLHSSMNSSVVRTSTEGRRQLSPRAAAILDRLALACGYIVVAGAICELISLVAYSVTYQQNKISIAMGVSLGACGLVTLLAAALGYLHGTETQKIADAAKRSNIQNASPQTSQPFESVRTAAEDHGQPFPKRFRQSYNTSGSTSRQTPTQAGLFESGKYRPHRFTRLDAHSDDDDDNINSNSKPARSHA